MVDGKDQDADVRSDSDASAEDSVHGATNVDDAEPTSEASQITTKSSHQEVADAVDSHDSQAERELTNGIHHDSTDDVSESAGLEERLAAATLGRDQLREEVTELRKSLESLQQQHEEEAERLNAQVAEAQSARQHAESQYQKLMGRVNNIRSQLGDRMKQDAVCLGH